MKKYFNRLLFFIILSQISLLMSCSKNETDTQKPLISNEFSDSFPFSCDTLYFGEEIDIRLKFTDNVELGTYSITIHDNFDHHSHSTNEIECEHEPEKTPVNPFNFIQDYTIPAETMEYITDISINIPAGNSAGEFDEGDYHFFVNVTDRAGWSSQLGIGIKILKKP